jgi:hypothetical protein
MFTNSGFREAPPTKNPSTSGCVPAMTTQFLQDIVELKENALSSLQLAAVTLPP